MNTRLMQRIVRGCFLLIFVVGTASLPGKDAVAQVSGIDVLYTDDADFDQGTLVSVNHDAPYNNQLQLDSQTKPFPFINVAASGRGTVVRTNTETGEIVGEYRTAPEGRGLNPSRTTVDLFGNVWTANRDEAGMIDGILHGSVVKIGLIIGGTRVDESGAPTPDGGYLAPPFGYNTCADRNEDGLIRTSTGLYDVLDWPDITDGMGGTEGLVQDAVDECILIYQRLPNAENPRHVSVDADNNVWVGGYPYAVRTFHKLDGSTGALLDSFDARQIGCGGYGGLIDGNGILWSVGGSLLRYDPAAHTGFCIQHYGYGLGIDTNGYIWMSLWDGGIVKIAPDGTVLPGFPKPTFPPSMMTSLATGEVSTLVAAEDATASRIVSPEQAAPEMTSLHSKDLKQNHRITHSTRDDTQALSAALDGDPGITFQVSPVDQWVQSSSAWTPGATITLTVAEGGSVAYTDTQVADPGGYFFFNLWGRFYLQRGQVVTVSDGTTTKTHTVMNLFVDGVDMEAETLFGRADSGTSVDLWVHGDGGTSVTADEAGHWTADFSGQTDLTWFSDGGSQQFDSDGDSTGVWWASPRFQVSPDDDWVQSAGTWVPGATITLTVGDGGDVVYSDTQTADIHGHFNFNFGGAFDLQRGQLVTVSDGTTTKTHTVMPLYVDAVSVAADTLSGRADASADVEVWVHGNGNLYVTPDGSGNWTADFSGLTDLTYLSDGGSQQLDSDGDGTGVWWASPRFQVAPDDEWVQSVRPWTPGTTITLTIEDGGAVVYTDSQVADETGSFNFNLWDVFDMQRGQIVTVSDGTTTKTHTVMPLYVDGMDVATDTVFGRAGAGTDVEAWVHGNGNVYVTADGSGKWIADFSGLTDLTYVNDGGSQQLDEDGDSTGVWWWTPSFQAHADDNAVNSWNRWTPGTTVTLTVTDGGIVVYTDSQTTDSHGNFGFSVGIDLDTGQQVTVTDGTLTKTHVVTDVNVTHIDTAADRVQGTANPGARVNVQVYFFNDWAERYVLAGLDGNWTADFSVAADGQPAYDITDLTFMTANEFDEDNDSTARRFGPRQMQNRGVAVTPIDNNVWVANSAYGTVTRLDNDGNVLKAIDTGYEPTGVAVDAAGKVWATNMGSNNAVRIDPAAGTDGLGAVDMTVDLGQDAWPYNYSDMTGTVVVGSTSPQGFWTVIQDSGTPGFEWGRIVWNTEPQGDEPPGTAIVVEARAADTEAGLGGQTFQAITNGSLFSMFGRYIEVRVTLKASAEGASPVLSDIRIQPHVLYAEIDIKPGSFPNTINCKNKKEVITVALLTTADFEALAVDHTTVTFEGAGEIHLGKDGLPVRHVEDVGLDGDMDLVFHFNLKDTALTCASTTGQLIGLTYEGIPVEGTDSIRMVIR